MTFDADATKLGRILWLGNRPNSTGNEPARLRHLGFAVTELADDALGQFMVGGAMSGSDRASVLPSSEKPQVSTDGARILNTRFDTIVVANDAVRTNEILRVFDGRVIIRAHGWRRPIGSELFHLGCYPIIQRRHQTYHVVTDAQTAKDDLAIGTLAIAPAWLDERLDRLKGTWNGIASKGAGKVVVSLPATDVDPIDRNYSLFIRQHFPDTICNHMIHLGLRDSDNWQRQRQRIVTLQTAAAYLYPYVDKNHVDITPLEMMLIGGPVVFFDGGYLSALMPAGAPGRARTVDEAHQLCDRLRTGDRVLIRDILASQAALLARYDVRVAGPQFDSTFSAILSEPQMNRPGVSRSGITYTCDLADRQMRRLMTALTFQPSDDAVAADWTSRDVITVFYRTVLDSAPDPENSNAYVAALDAGVRPIEVLRLMMNHNLHLLSDHRNRFIRTLRVAPNGTSSRFNRPLI
ncbi:hypothetical protein [Rhizobium sp. FY34]|uniref:hypothetical protein n=1 Tax=Rhizobium sp. FY34 TaxID=2562309 RepID=UPI0010C135EF|nr:hypothetical protein [Rhizobium sp. FY34]